MWTLKTTDQLLEWLDTLENEERDEAIYLAEKLREAVDEHFDVNVTDLTLANQELSRIFNK
jgi:hypothetical protein